MVSNVSCSPLDLVPLYPFTVHLGFRSSVHWQHAVARERWQMLGSVQSQQHRASQTSPLGRKKDTAQLGSTGGDPGPSVGKSSSLALCKWENRQQFAFALGFAETGLLKVGQQQIVPGRWCTPQPPGNTELENLVESLSHYFGSHFLTHRKVVNTLFQWMADRPESNYTPQYETSRINKAHFSAGDSVGCRTDPNYKTLHYLHFAF